MGSVTLAIFREPEPGKPEVFIKTDDGREFVYRLPRKAVWQLHNQTGAWLAMSEPE